MFFSFNLLGRETLKQLDEVEINCSYVLINSVSYIIKEVSCFPFFVFFLISSQTFFLAF